METDNDGAVVVFIWHQISEMPVCWLTTNVDTAAPVICCRKSCQCYDSVHCSALYKIYALYKIFKLNNDDNLLYTQYCFGVLPINFVLDLRKWCFHVSCPRNVVTVYLFIMSSMICLVSMNLTGYVQCILCVDSPMDILVHQSGTFFVLWYFDCCIDCIVVFWSVCLSVSTHCCVNKDYHCATWIAFYSIPATIIVKKYPQWNLWGSA